MRKVLTSSAAIAQAVRMCKPKVISAYPITPQTIIVEDLAGMVANGQLDAEYVNVESEHSAISLVLGAQATGVRTFTASASQGLALMHEILYIVSGMRLPIVMAVANRALSAPLNIWNDQQDSIGERDSGWLQLYCESAQEAHDTIPQAYRIGEKVGLPVMVCIDGFVLSHTHEPVELLDESKVDSFLPKYAPAVSLDPKKPVSIGCYATPEFYMDFRAQQQDAMSKAKEDVVKCNEEFAEIFKRNYGNGLFEIVNVRPSTKAVIFTMGSLSGTVREYLRDHKEVGLVRLRSFRPFPGEELRKALKDVKSIGVLEKDVSIGNQGAVYTELKAAMQGCRTVISGFVCGLGGRDITLKDIDYVSSKVMKGKEVVEWIGYAK
jgi:pyruvate ferredoxin oxidoreductase alpha subunit